MLGSTQWVHTMYPLSSDKTVYAYTIWIKVVQDLPCKEIAQFITNAFMLYVIHSFEPHAPLFCLSAHASEDILLFWDKSKSLVVFVTGYKYKY